MSDEGLMRQAVLRSLGLERCRETHALISTTNHYPA